ncbi:hypothetical protein G9464_13675 [Halostella sp. JP-L12]|uniref:hypothetical protein n=1 Tax=Halostella TaxID=1843185 RepID=UPI000EF7D028|nr:MULTISPECIES: hypothetical protein [Halostella]NHN48637.1 hypothetical protein [Halostella sp. JP-L12]
MYGVREILAIVLSVGLGLILIGFPEAFLRMQMVGRGPRDPGEYGRDYEPPATYTRVIRAFGAAAVVVGLYILARPML